MEKEVVLAVDAKAAVETKGEATAAADMAVGG